MRTSEEEAEWARFQEEFVALRVKLCARTEDYAKRGRLYTAVEVADMRLLLHMLTIMEFKPKELKVHREAAAAQ